MTSINATVDRIEGEWIILISNNGKVFQVPGTLFPGLKPSDAVIIAIERDESAMSDAKDRINKIRSGLNRVEI